MKKFKIISVTLGIIIAIFVVTCLVFSNLYKDNVKSYIIEQINNNINTEIDVKNVAFSIFKKFPYASLEFKQVTAKEVTTHDQKEILFSAQSIYLQFNIIDIINENYSIKKIHVENGIINIKIDKNGNDNYHFWKETKNAENQLSIELENLTFKHVNFYILNEYKNVDMDINVAGLSLSGNFSKDEFTLKTQANLQINQINDNGESVLKNKSILINTSLAVNQITNIYHIEKGQIGIKKLNFSLSGNIVNKKIGIQLDIHSKGKELEIEELFSLLPRKQRETLSAYKTVGKITYTSNIQGELSSKKSPSFDADFSIKNGKIMELSSKQSLTNINVNGNFTNGKSNAQKTSKLTLNKLEANFGADHISGNYIITNFSNPYIEFDSKASLNVATVREFLKLDNLEIANGNIQINLKYDGYIKELNDIKASELRRLNARGNATLNKVNLKFKDHLKPIQNINGSFKFNNNNIKFDALKFKINKSSFELDGKIQNLLAFLFVENELLAIKTNLRSKMLNLDDLLASNKENKKTSEYTVNLPENIVLDFKANVDTFQFRKFNATNFIGRIQLEDKILTATNISFNAMQGKIKGDVVIDDSKGNELLITSKISTNKIDIYELFYQFENFNQTAIKAENLRGLTSTSIEFASIFDKNLNIKKDKIYAQATLNINDGELIDYEPVLALSKYIEVEELKHIKFNSLATQIEIKDQIVSLPKTEIKSSLLDLTISGTHTFANKIDYRFRLLLDDVLWRKAKAKKKENSEFGYIADDGLGKTTLFLRMKGTTDDYKLSYDTKGLKESWSTNLKKEKSSLKKVLNKEFGWFKKDSTISEEKTKEDDGFIIEWEDGEVGTESNVSKLNNKTKTNQKKKKKKKGLGKFIDKIAKPDKEEYEDFDDID